jgi:hypothetical protein
VAVGSVWIVICEHNRYGEYIAGAYENLPAATAHKQYLDGRIDGWENMCGGEIRQMAIHANFTSPNNPVTHDGAQPRSCV